MVSFLSYKGFSVLNLKGLSKRLADLLGAAKQLEFLDTCWIAMHTISVRLLHISSRTCAPPGDASSSGRTPPLHLHSVLQKHSDA